MRQGGWDTSVKQWLTFQPRWSSYGRTISNILMPSCMHATSTMHGRSSCFNGKMRVLDGPKIIPFSGDRHPGTVSRLGNRVCAKCWCSQHCHYCHAYQAGFTHFLLLFFYIEFPYWKFHSQIVKKNPSSHFQKVNILEPFLHIHS